MEPLVHRSHHDTGKHAANLADRSEDSSPLSNLQRLVPGAQDVDGATVQARLEETLEEADHTELLVGFTGSADHGQAGPDEQCERQPKSRRNLLDNESMWDLADTCTVVC